MSDFIQICYEAGEKAAVLRELEIIGAGFSQLWTLATDWSWAQRMLAEAEVQRGCEEAKSVWRQSCLSLSWLSFSPPSKDIFILLKTAAKVIGAVRLQGSSKPEEGRRPLQVVCTSTEGPQRATVALIIISFVSWKRREGRGQTRMLYLLLI